MAGAAMDLMNYGFPNLHMHEARARMHDLPMHDPGAVRRRRLNVRGLRGTSGSRGIGTMQNQAREPHDLLPATAATLVEVVLVHSVHELHEHAGAGWLR
jgi:hypothetical protein